MGRSLAGMAGSMIEEWARVRKAPLGDSTCGSLAEGMGDPSERAGESPCSRSMCGHTTGIQSVTLYPRAAYARRYGKAWARLPRSNGRPASRTIRQDNRGKGGRSSAQSLAEHRPRGILSAARWKGGGDHAYGAGRGRSARNLSYRARHPITIATGDRDYAALVMHFNDRHHSILSLYYRSLASDRVVMHGATTTKTRAHDLSVLTCQAYECKSGACSHRSRRRYAIPALGISQLSAIE